MSSSRYKMLAALLRRSRQNAGLTQRELGKRLRQPHTYVHKTEVGSRRIDPIEFIDWCKACGVSPSEAIGRLARREAAKSG